MNGSAIWRPASSRLLKNYCGAGLLCCRSLKSSTYFRVRLAFSIAYAVHPSLLMTFFNSLLGCNSLIIG